MKKFIIKSYCKINLSLRVLKKLRSGYHNINSFITFCNVYDVISIQIHKNLKDKITFVGKFKKKINQKANTITKVLYLLRKNNLLKNNTFTIEVEKNIPHGSGLGGGSSNAANLLNFLNLKMNLKIKKNELFKIANKIGFDVPISLEKQNILLMGKNNSIKRIRKKFNFNVLIAYPNLVCSTETIYKKNKKFSKSQPRLSSHLKNKKKLIDFLINEKNDLEETASKIYPKIGQIINLIQNQEGCYFSRMTGSGSACIGIFHNMKTAIFTQKLIKLKFPNYWTAVSKTM